VQEKTHEDKPKEDEKPDWSHLSMYERMMKEEEWEENKLKKQQEEMAANDAQYRQDEYNQYADPYAT
jgi:hypothetical protein